jgi:uncharacterized membrane protein YgcG
MSLRRSLNLVLLVLALGASRCSIYRRYQASKPEVIKQTEAMLSEAGFSKIAIDTSDSASLASNLPPRELRSYPADGGYVYWYYDPDVCGCVFEGRQDTFDRYQMLMRQQHDTVEYAAESQEGEIASLNALNQMYFPPPMLWYGVGIYGGFHSQGGGGGHILGGGGGHHGGGHHGGGGGGHIGHGH